MYKSSAFFLWFFHNVATKQNVVQWEQMNLDDCIKAKSSRIYALKGPSSHLFDNVKCHLH
jgi:hypothetical protein